MKFAKTVGTSLAATALVFALIGCQKEEGPAEKAGKEVDKAVEKIGEKVEQAGDSIQDAAKGGK